MRKKPSQSSRGTLVQPRNRFETILREIEPGSVGETESSLPRTQFIPDHSQSIISYNDSPDIGYNASVNPYRGCEHGCIYCYARPTHEYLGFSSGLDFESKILVKDQAPELLRRELSSSRWQPQVLAFSGVTDPYQPIERKLQITRRCLEVLVEFRNPVAVVTKNRLVARDIDLLSELARHDAAAVTVSLTTLDAELHRVLEPRTSPPLARLDTIAKLAAAKIPVGVLVAPVIPGLTDSEIPQLITAAAKAGAQYAYYTVLRLPHANARLFEDWLTRHYPNCKDKVISQIRSLRGGELSDSRFGKRLSGEGRLAEQIKSLFRVASKRAGLAEARLGLSTASFRRVIENQQELF